MIRDSLRTVPRYLVILEVIIVMEVSISEADKIQKFHMLTTKNVDI